MPDSPDGSTTVSPTPDGSTTGSPTPDGSAAHAHPLPPQLLEALRSAPQRVLVATDFDGTLAPIVADPEDSRPAPGAVEALRRLANTVGLVAIVTGRAASTVLRLGGLDALHGTRFVIRGAYGAETWDAATGQLEDPPPGTAIEQARAQLPGLLEALPPTIGAGASLEDKGRAIALHTRRAADPQAAFEALRPQVAALGDELGLRFEPGRLVLELRESGAHKGEAVQDLASQLPGGPAAVVFAGDDLGDLAAFQAVGEIGASGVPVLRVRVTSSEAAVPDDLVDLTVDDPAAVVALFHQLAEAAAQ
ncbi:MAG: trehalose-phosphatase [Actinomycetes bacterium]